ncbi:MAG: hypothetical protein U1F27_07315 [Turneriella sp.]
MKTKLGISLAFAGLMVLSNCSKTEDTAAGGTTAGQFDEDSSCVANPPTPTSATSALANGSTLSGKQSSSVLLGTGNTYTISGVVNFACGTELKIQSGVTIKASTSTTSGLVIQRGARINAVGTAASPIVMTSDKTAGSRAPGDWGGLTIQGRSVWNQAGNEVTTEFDTGKAGLASGAVTTDNSGTIQYVRIEFAGKKLTTTKEWNGLSLYAVGSGTTIDHLNVSRGSDDGIEFFGGTVNIKYIISFANGDDMFDWTNGWTGTIQYGIAYLGNVSTQRDADSNIMEADNDATTNGLTPRSAPIIANTVFATDAAQNAGATATAYKNIFRFRVGTYGKIYNSVLDNTRDMKIAFESTDTITGVTNGDVRAFGLLAARNVANDGTTALTTANDGTFWSAATSADESLFMGTGSATQAGACIKGSDGTGALTSALAVANKINTDNAATPFEKQAGCTGGTGQTLPTTNAQSAATGFTADTTVGFAAGTFSGAWTNISTDGL